jgi:hypothetical protein
MAQYGANSPYADTGYIGDALGVMVDRPLPKEVDDQSFTINQTYQYRPDLLAHDLYGDAGLWWVFAQRNPNTLKNPLIDFKEGTLIYLPKISTLKSVLGI